VTYIAWQGSEALKSEHCTRIERHRKADEIVQGIGFDGRRGCAVGCSLDKYDHALFAEVFGLEPAVPRLVDRIHESLTPKQSIAWPGRFANALPVGADTRLLWPRFAVWMLRRVRRGKTGDVRGAIDRVVALYERRIAGDEPPKDEWRNAAYAVDAAAYAYVAAAYAAAAAADAADAEAAAAAASYAADRSRFWTTAAKELVRIASTLPIGGAQ
jgi:hypothetical protein